VDVAQLAAELAVTPETVRRDLTVLERQGPPWPAATGAIPFAAGDPLRVIPSLMLGSAVTGALVMAFGNTSRAPHGGIWVVGLIGKPLLYVLAILIGTAITAASVIVLKSAGRREPAEAEEPAAARAATA
jgi:fructose PTS system EIIBC or EIIC component